MKRVKMKHRITKKKHVVNTQGIAGGKRGWVIGYLCANEGI